jgi:hypothetical protein
MPKPFIFKHTRESVRNALNVLNDLMRDHTSAELTLASNPNGEGLQYEVVVPAFIPGHKPVRLRGRNLGKTVARAQKKWAELNKQRDDRSRHFLVFICSGKMRIHMSPKDVRPMIGLWSGWPTENDHRVTRLVYDRHEDLASA